MTGPETALDLTTEVGSLTFKNPVLTASGTFGYGLEFSRFFDISQLGGFCTKGLSLKPLKGNPPGRIAETPLGMLNAIGLENVGVEAFKSEKLPRLQKYDTRIIANIFGKSIREFELLAEALEECPQVSALELNISCPNISEGGIHFGHDPEMTHRVTAAVRASSSKPVWVKLSPNVTDIAPFAQACEAAGADAVSLVNTYVGMSIDVFRRRPRLSNVTGGLSGPAIRPLAVRLVHQTRQATNLPIVGIGGISSGRDALEFLIAGASAIQIGTANFYEPAVSLRVIEELRHFCLSQGVSRIRSLVGSLEIEEGQFYY